MQSINFLNTEYFFQKAYELLSIQDFTGLLYLLSGYLSAFLDAIKPLSILLTLLLIVGIIYCSIRIRHVKEQMEELYNLHPTTGTATEIKNKQWERICNHIDSKNESDWRLAILEADIILDEMLESMGYHGETVSDKLKKIESSDFTNLEKAWEAHKIRNSIAHEGNNFTLNEREAKRVIGLYEAIFKEFHFI